MQWGEAVACRATPATLPFPRVLPWPPRLSAVLLWSTSKIRYISFQPLRPVWLEIEITVIAWWWNFETGFLHITLCLLRIRSSLVTLQVISLVYFHYASIVIATGNGHWTTEAVQQLPRETQTQSHWNSAVFKWVPISHYQSTLTPTSTIYRTKTTR